MWSYDGKKPLIAFIVPTGIGASVGGYAGDASLYAKMFTEDFNVIVNPNVVNAACFSGITENMLYLEGWSLTKFIKGELNLIPSQNNKIGIIFDKGISRGILNVHLNTVKAVQTIYGCDIAGYEVTDEECSVKFYKTSNGISTGSVLNNKTLVEAGKKLIKKGARALAVVCKFDEPPQDNYQYGEGVDIVGGVEAVISHYLSRELNVPVVHAPAFENIEITQEEVDAKSSAEYITPTFLPCLLLGLKNAPLFASVGDNSCIKSDYSTFCNIECITSKDLKALIMPYNSLGSSIVLNCINNGIKVIAIKENQSILNITKEIINKNAIMELETYSECYKYLKEELYEK